MIKSKTAFITFLILVILLFPFSVLFLWNDFAASVIPGWHTTIRPYWLGNSIIKFLILFFVVIAYWKLKKSKTLVNKKLFFVHLILTLPAILISKISLYTFIKFNSDSSVEKVSNDFYIVSSIIMIVNILFLIGQILFGVYYFNQNKGNR